MMTELSAVQWLQVVGLGACAGIVGQMMRVLIGLKKLDQEASDSGKTRAEILIVSRLVISLAIGATAGAVAALLAGFDPAHVPSKELLALASAGYAGADFLEGAMSRFLPSNATGAGATPPATPEGVAPEEYLG